MSPRLIPLDLLVLLLLIPAQVEISPGGGYFLIILLMLYVGVELWQPLGHLAEMPASFGPARLSFLLRFTLLLLMLGVTPVAVTLQNIAARQAADAPRSTDAGQADLTAAYLRFHDGALQVEAALDHLAAGRNPYVATYYDTHLTLYQHPDTDLNPAVEHMIYLPGILFLSWPFRAGVEMLLGYYDQRLLTLLAYLIVLLMLPRFTRAPGHKLALVAAVGLSPWLAKPIALGMNDILVILFLLPATLALLRRQPFRAALWLGVAATMKQSAWLIAPFFLLALYQQLPPARRLKETLLAAGIVGAIMLLVIGPLAFWDMPAFLDDTFAYAGGTAATLNYPIRGYTIGHLLVILGAIPTSMDYYPFWRLQTLLGLPLLLGLLVWQFRQQRPAALFLAAGAFILGLGFISRFFQENYIGFTIILLLLGLFTASPRQETGPSSE